QAEDGIRDRNVTGVQTCALPICIIQPLIEQIEQLPHHTKAKKVIELIKEIDQEKVIIFTQYRATQHYLQWYLQQYGISSVPFQGGFNRGKKDWMQQLFK